jgi:lipopolysaccharide export system ATP-binding protein
MEEKRRRKTTDGAASRSTSPHAAGRSAPAPVEESQGPAVRSASRDGNAAAAVDAGSGLARDAAASEASAAVPRAPVAPAAGARAPLSGMQAAPAAAQAGAATIEGAARPMLEVEGLVKIYGGRTVVDNVSFGVASGEIIGLLGKNGAGKTTTFRMTIGMITPDEGAIRFFGKEVTKLPMYKRARLGMGYLSQESSVFRGLTVEQNLNAILETTDLKPAERVRKRDDLVDEFGLNKLLHSKAAVLSGGEKRRLEIARALITAPSLILLDEPFSGVDPIAVSDIQQIIFRLREKGIGILLTDHNVRETLNTTDRSFIILDGRIIAQGSRDEILSNQHARKYYLGESFTM